MDLIIIHRLAIVTLYLSLLAISACGRTEKASVGFLQRANKFWNLTISNKCYQLKELVHYPVLMDGISVDNNEELNSRCVALYTSAKFLTEKNGVSTKNLSLTTHERGWLKKEVLEGHPILRRHAGNDVSFFLLEVVSNNIESQPSTFIFRRNHEDSNGSWDIIMFEDYSLMDKIEKK